MRPSRNGRHVCRRPLNGASRRWGRLSSDCAANAGRIPDHCPLPPQVRRPIHRSLHRQLRPTVPTTYSRYCLLARWGDLGTKGLPVPLDVAPMFETVEDLESASTILERLLQDESYSAHLRQRGSRQMVMVGFSDSNRDGGVASARWTLQNAQRNLVAVCQRFGIALTLFHGRGSTLSRGGGRLDEALLASPAGAVTGRLRITEQGDMINAKYGLRGIAMRSLKRSVGSLLWATAGDYAPAVSEDRWRAIMGEIAGTSRQAYKEMVFDRAEFNTYFRAATPIDCDRAARHGLTRREPRIMFYGRNEPRANPWLFAWTQNRAFLPAWFGLGTGLEHAARKHGVGRSPQNV